MLNFHEKAPEDQSGATTKLGAESLLSDSVFNSCRQAALALLIANDPPLAWKAGSFLGQCAVATGTLSDKQRSWLSKLLERAGLPALAKGAA